MVGTLYNAATVLMGASAGIWLGKFIPPATKDVVFQSLGLFTLGLGFMMGMEMNDPFAIFLALVLGAIAGQQLRIQERVERATSRWGQGLGAAMIQAIMLFCVGAMTLIGCMQDGLHGDPTVLFIKGTMDLVSAAFLAAALGRGVLWAAPAVLLIQGSMTWGFQWWGQGWSEALVADLTGLGGLLLLALGLDLLRIKSFSLLNFMPAFLLVPLTQSVASWVSDQLPQLIVF